jgi:hypothetical protein
LFIEGFFPGSELPLAEIGAPLSDSFNCYLWILHWEMLSSREIEKESFFVFAIAIIWVIIPVSFSVSTYAWPIFKLKE